MAPKGKHASSVLTTPERFPTADAWRQGRRWRRWRKLFPMLCGIVLVIIMILVAALGGSLVNEIVAIGMALTPNFTRLARSLALTIRANDYIMAARALGCTPVRIMLRHILPNAISTLVVIATLDIASAIRTEAGLSFLGLGVPPPTPSWGNILSEGRQYIKCCTWLTTYSGLAIMLAVLAFNLMGDALRDLLDPRLRGE